MIKVESYQIKKAKSGSLVPVVNDVHLHSIYNPEKEAKSFIASHKQTLEERSSILVLGLGFGFHIVELEKSLREIHGDNFKIAVIEPNRQVAKDYKDKANLQLENATIYSYNNISALYQDKELLDVLINRPGIIAHPASFNLYNDYFKLFLSYIAPQTLERTEQLVKSKTLKNYLGQFDQTYTLDKVIGGTLKKQKSLVNDLDFAMLAFSEIVSTAKSSKGIN